MTDSAAAVITTVKKLDSRAMNLANLPWQSCQPPNTEAAITDHWPKPIGCN
jgi:hypothetical protein